MGLPHDNFSVYSPFAIDGREGNETANDDYQAGTAPAHGREAQIRAVKLLLLFIRNLVRKALLPPEDIYFEIQEIWASRGSVRIGVIASASVIGLTLLYLHNSLGGIGSENLAAPQATLMATIIKGLLNQNLPWGLVLIGIFLSVALELCGIRSLSFAVGSYLPIATTAPIFAGGMVRAWVERQTGKAEESELSAGTLFSSGLIAGGSLAGILFAVLVGTGNIAMFQGIGNALPALHSDGVSGQIATALLFLALAVVVARTAIRKVE